MTISMYKASVPIFVQFLTSLSAILDKTAAHAEARKIDPAVFLGMRLYPDMFHFARQVGEANRHAANCCARLAGVDLPAAPSGEPDIAELKRRVAATIDYVKTFKPAQIDGSEDRAVVIKFPNGAERHFTGQSLLLTFHMPNFYFHVTTAYDILRHGGIDVGKRDFLGTPVEL